MLISTHRVQHGAAVDTYTYKMNLAKMANNIFYRAAAGAGVPAYALPKLDHVTSLDVVPFGEANTYTAGHDMWTQH